MQGMTEGARRPPATAVEIGFGAGAPSGFRPRTALPPFRNQRLSFGCRLRT